MSSILRLAADMFSESWPSAPTWNVESDMPDLHGKVVLVTGANTGIGKETARALYAHNAKVYIACRDRLKAEQAIADIRGSTSTVHGQISVLQLDLSDLHSIKQAAEEFHSKEGKLDVLFNNAGVMRSPTEMVTKQGYDLQWGTVSDTNCP
jgi:retinol dehydrogenase-12